MSVGFKYRGGIFYAIIYPLCKKNVWPDEKANFFLDK